MPFFHLLAIIIIPKAINMDPMPQLVPIAIPICTCYCHEIMLMFTNYNFKGVLFAMAYPKEDSVV